MKLQPNDIRNRIVSILNEQGKTQSQFCEECGLSPLALQRMRDFFPQVDNIAIMAEKLEVSIDYLIYGNSDNEDVFLHLINYQRLSKEDKNLVDGIIKIILEKHDYKLSSQKSSQNKSTV